MNPRWLLCVAVAVPVLAFAETALRDRSGLAVAISRSGYCCVVDARSPPLRDKTPIAESVPWRKGVKVNPTAAIVVIADTDADAVRIGRDLERSTGATEVFAVKGGEPTWRAYLAEALGAPPPGVSFIIPRNTCESGETLQQLRSGRP